MMPVYIAEYEVDHEVLGRTFQVVMEAHNPSLSKAKVHWPAPEEMRKL